MDARLRYSKIILKVACNINSCGSRLYFHACTLYSTLYCASMLRLVRLKCENVLYKTANGPDDYFSIAVQGYF